jgi:hypothetical protein
MRLFIREFEDTTYELFDDLKWVNYRSPSNVWRFTWMTAIFMLVVIGLIVYVFRESRSAGPEFMRNSQSLTKLALYVFRWSNFFRGIPAALYLIMFYYQDSIQSLEKIDRPEPLIHNDPQNVHDSGITRHLEKAINMLDKSNPHPRPWSEISYEISHFLEDSGNDDALDVFNYLVTAEMTHGLTGKTELQILGLVWERIHAPVNRQDMEALKNSLLEQLADCQEDGQVLCGSGRITRIVQSLEELDAEHIVDLKPLWAVKGEIANYFGLYVEKIRKQAPKKYIDAVDALTRTPEQETLANRFNTCLRHNIDEKLNKTYIETNLLDRTQLDEIAKPYLMELQPP